MLAKGVGIACAGRAAGPRGGDIERVEARRAGGSRLLERGAALRMEGHDALFSRFKAALAPGGQLAVQMPANDDHPSHRVAAEVAREAPFREELGGFVRTSSNLKLEEYATLLDRLGFEHERPDARCTRTGSRRERTSSSG